ncbi:MAG: hypothetical protein KJZ86_10710 [Caldilineaceae bacterium]|nr:hypothetical protein [Caldilineaceae bacterium]
MSVDTRPWSMRQRVAAVLSGQKPDRHPFIDRLELWQKGLAHTGGLPPAYAEMSLNDIHRQVGIGRQKFQSPYAMRLRGVEMSSTFNGEPYASESEPVVPRFPDVDSLTPPDRLGETHIRLSTPVGALTLDYVMLEEMLATGARAYLAKHPISAEADYPVVEYILERIEFVPQFDRFRSMQTQVGEHGYVIPVMERIPFQQLLIDYFDSVDFFYALHDNPTAIERLIKLLDHKVTEAIQRLADLDEPYVQLGDNLEGTMTNPRIFRQYVLSDYQRYSEMFHAQGKRVGSHTDGNLRSLLGLLAESGLDVCESIATSPLVPYPFAEIWSAWQNGGPIIWGGIPSPLLEARTPLEELHAYVLALLDLVGDRPIIIGVSDMVLPVNDIERVAWVAKTIEAHAL